MRCPFCGHDDSQVKDSRPTEDNAAIRRRRFCGNCGQRFTTIERVQLRELTVVKADGRRVTFDRDKLARSIMIAVRKRPIDEQQVDRIVNSIQRRLESSGESEIPSTMIGEMVMRCDRELSSLAPRSLDAITGHGPAAWRALAQLITALENHQADAALVAELHQRASQIQTPVLGITGTGGAGKSSLTDELVRRFRLDQDDALRIAVRVQQRLHAAVPRSWHFPSAVPPPPRRWTN